MKVLDLMNLLISNIGNVNEEVRVRIVKRNAEQVVVAEKLIPIIRIRKTVSISDGSIYIQGITIEESDLDSYSWVPLKEI